MIIRYAQARDKREIKRIWNYCFQDPPAFVEYYFNNVYLPENTILVEDRGRIISSLQLNQYRIKLRGMDLPVSYVVGVSTLPEFRARGMMKKVMKEMLAELVKKGQEVSLLMPIDTRLYRKFGYENCYDIHKNTIDIDRLKSFRSLGIFKQVEFLPSEQAPRKVKSIISKMLTGDEEKLDTKVEDKFLVDLVSIYESANRDLNGYVIRDKKYFNRHIKEVRSEDGYVYINYFDERPIGYISYTIDGEEINVRDLYYIDSKALKSLLSFIYSHNTQAKRVYISQPVNSKLRYYIENHRWLETRLEQFMMARVNILEKAMDSYFSKLREGPAKENLPDSNKISVSLRISDDYIEENNGLLTISIDENYPIYIFTREDNVNQSPILTINDFTGLFFGYRSVYEIEELELLEEEEKKFLDSIFPKMQNHINEYI